MTPRAWCLAFAAAAWLLALITQSVAHDFLPPAISISQYGVGRWGFLFSAWIFAQVGASWTTGWFARTRTGLATSLLLVGGLGAMVMAVVRTDPGGLQQSVNAKVHLVGAVIALSALPLGLWQLLERVRGWVTTLARALTGSAAVSLVLLLLAASGWDSLGIGAPKSWAFWQSLATLLEMVLMSLAAVALPLRRSPSADV